MYSRYLIWFILFVVAGFSFTFDQLPIPMMAAPIPKDSGLLPGEKMVEFEYVIEGEKKKGKSRVLTLDIGAGEKMEFVRILGGRFTMGSPKDEEERMGHEDQHEVEITKDFYLGRYVVTQAQYKAVTGDNPSHFKGDRLPVEEVSWVDANAYCKALSMKLERKVCLPEAKHSGSMLVAVRTADSVPFWLKAERRHGQLQWKLSNRYEDEGSLPGEDGGGGFLSGQHMGPLRHARERLAMVSGLVRYLFEA